MSCRTFFLALFRYIQMLGREGCSRTALEYCKLLLNLDPHDPLFILFIIDYYAIRSQAQNATFFHSSFSAISLLIPTVRQSGIEWAKLVRTPEFLLLASISQVPSRKTGWPWIWLDFDNRQGKSSEEECSKISDSADELLQKALMMFPTVLPLLAKKATINLMEIQGNVANDLAQHHFFLNTYCPPSLQHLVKLYVERNYALWKDPAVMKWLKENTSTVVKKVEADDPLVASYTAVVKEMYADSSTNIYNHLLLSGNVSFSMNSPAQNIRTHLKTHYHLIWSKQSDMVGADFVCMRDFTKLQYVFFASHIDNI